MINALTIDVEEYFHPTAFAHHVHPNDWDRYPRRGESNTYRLLELLAERNVYATFFIVGWVAERCPDLVRQIDRLGHAIGCRSYAHRAIYDGSREDIPIGGGGYLRLFPYCVTASAIRRLNKVENQPAMVYLHPWEIDPDQPRMPGPWRSRFRQYQNLHSTEGKLKRLLQDFSFSSMEEALAQHTLPTV